MKFLSIFLLVGFLGCSSVPENGQFSATPASEVFKVRSDHFVPKDAQFFLIAGSQRNANFVEEIVRHKRFLRASGVPKEKIACYFPIPFQTNFDHDEAQFKRLAKELSSCHFASVKKIRSDLIAAARSSKFLYLYVTTHGSPPISDDAKRAKSASKRFSFERDFKKFPVLDQYHLMVDGLPDGETAGWYTRVGAYRAGMSEEDVFLTPRILKGVLEKHYRGIPKFVMIQACYSGGFLKDPREKYAKDTLDSLDNIVAISASRWDLVSFGCGDEDDVSFFGEAYLKTLEKFRFSDPRKVAWPSFFLSLRRQVSKIESREVSEASHPDFISNYSRHLVRK